MARYALTYAEKHPYACQANKFHNCRLLVTFDSPHKGANIPLSLQHVYRVLVGSFLGMNTVTQQAIGLVNNMFLDAMSAKQMLLYHADTYNPFIPFPPYLRIDTGFTFSP